MTKDEIVSYHRKKAEFHRRCSEYGGLATNERMRREHLKMSEYYEELANEIEFNLGDIN